MKFSSKTLSQTLVKLCSDKDIEHIIISPGSRNAPLTIGFTEYNHFNNYSIIDERCAGFFALGIAQQIKKPVVLVCTSGSAMLNYYPAIAEAFYSDIPLVVITADRPAAYIDIGDGQTIRQENAFANHILYSANCKEGEGFQAENEVKINTALNTAFEQKGPVHINVPFSEPLYLTVEKPNVFPVNTPPKSISEFEESILPFADLWNKASKKMILVGVLTPGSIEEKFVKALAEDQSVLVLTETTSNLQHPNFIPAIDQLIAPLDDEGFKKLQPEILLTFGGMVVSKKIKAFLRTYSPKFHWHVDNKKAYDTYFALNHHFKTSINSFFHKFLSLTNNLNSNYRPYWHSVKEYRLQKHSEYESQITFSDFKVFSEIFRSIPQLTHLQLSNSATIRYAQLFEQHPSTEIFCNRGTSGIDGSTSTAIGAATVSRKPTVFITGDLSFFYDSNALWNNYIPNDFKIIVVNNGGGGIFRILPGDKNSDNFSTYFETNHKLSARQLCDMYGFQYKTANDEDTLKKQLSAFFECHEHGPSLLEIFTPSNINDKVLLNYFKTLL